MLEMSPNTLGDFREFDRSDRPVEVIIIGKFSIAYWADHAVREVKVIEIEYADC